jgi:hypothetical protein
MLFVASALLFAASYLLGKLGLPSLLFGLTYSLAAALFVGAISWGANGILSWLRGSEELE